MYGCTTVVAGDLYWQQLLDHAAAERSARHPHADSSGEESLQFCAPVSVRQVVYYNNSC